MSDRWLPTAAVPRIDLNADLGEWDAGSGDDAAERHACVDAALMEAVSSVNVACGGHAGDAGSMRATVRAAARMGLAIGAHPSYPDRTGFGRTPMALGGAALEREVAHQIALLAAIAAEEGARLAHVKPHGALYHRAAVDPAVAERVAAAIAAVDRGLVVVGLSGGALLSAARRLGLQPASEVFCDRAYAGDGGLVPRGEEGAILTDAAAAAARVVTMLREGRVAARDGRPVDVVADTACIHGDSPDAAAFARRLRDALEDAGVVIGCPWRG